MTAFMRQISHPGPPAKYRICALPCEAVPVRLTLVRGQSLADAVPKAWAAAGFTSGYLRLDGCSFAPLTFVTPGPAPDDSHAAWYSDTFQLAVPSRVRHGGAHLGLRDGEPFLHCHGIWDSPDNLPDAGHLLCEDSILAQDCTVTGWGIKGAGLVGRHDPETNFTLFRPEGETTPKNQNAFLITLRPNQDIGAALLGFADQHHIPAAQIEGIGSLVGTAFDDDKTIASFAAEILIRSGQVKDGAIVLDVVSVGFDGRAHLGRLARDANAVCVTAEILLLDNATCKAPEPHAGFIES